MYANDDYFDKWIQKFYGEVRDISRDISRYPTKQRKYSVRMNYNLDNQYLCRMLHVSHRTLQRYRTDGFLPFLKRGQKIYYKGL